MRRFLFFATAALFWSSCLFAGGGTGATDTGQPGTDAAANMTTPPDVGTADVGRADIGPDSGTRDTGPDVPDTCGDGAVQLHEKCDPMIPDGTPGACPRFCDDGVACTRDGVAGSPLTCDAVCATAPIETCMNGDGCCPGGCSPDDDDDCSETVVCGDGVVSGTEVCDAALPADQPGACPTADDCAPMACMRSRIDGSAASCSAQCAYTQITQCADGDGCCPTGCQAANDDDCSATCGNGVIDPGELCDGNCPTTCNDNNPCTDDMLQVGASPCSATCVFVERAVCIDNDQCCPSGCDAASDGDCSGTCGNGTIEPDETCDGNCPQSCDDQDACTTDTSSGAVATCSRVCSNVPITSCQADGCCAPGCNANNDPDCEPVCGNNVVESGETCDGNCAASCDDGNACTTDATVGSAASCTLSCAYTDVTMCLSGDGCCPGGCNGLNDTDCPAVCGNGVVEGGETCDGNCPPSCADNNACTDDIRTGQASQCNVVCSNVPKTMCVDGDGCCPGGCNALNDDDCSASCPNGVVEGNETCDGNCPTQETCKNLGPCKTLIGSAAQCTAQCVNQEGCTPCMLGGNCGCTASEVCEANVCTAGDPSSDNCTQACTPNAFCAAWNGFGWKCDMSEGDCYQCDATTECPNHLACINRACTLPATCDEARFPNAYCQFVGEGNTCNTEKKNCYFACQSRTDCPQPDHGCSGGVCEVAGACNLARSPNTWCQLYTNGTTCTFAGLCL